MVRRWVVREDIQRKNSNVAMTYRGTNKVFASIASIIRSMVMKKRGRNFHTADFGFTTNLFILLERERHRIILDSTLKVKGRGSIDK
jgi:hypothetical protein